MFCGKPLLAAPRRTRALTPSQRPNVVFVFGDQWRAQAFGYAGDPNVRTPHADRLADESVSFVNAVSGCPVCSPYRASLLTGQTPLTHGVFLNDAPLGNRAVSIARVFGRAGYRTAYVGKWHVDGRGRVRYIPPRRRQGFQFWRALECSHDYNHSFYFGDSTRRQVWDGYDAVAQTREARRFICETDDDPFLLFLSWGPPHNPYDAAPAEYRRLYKPSELEMRPNVPRSVNERAREEMAGYYAHCTALDDCLGELRRALEDAGKADNTVLVFSSDHGDMLGSHGVWRKQWPYDESIRVPFLVHWPAGLGREARRRLTPVDACDVMPTLLGLAELEIPATVEGRDFSPLLRGDEPETEDDADAVIACYWPFGEWRRSAGGREYRGLRTLRHTFVRSLDGPWLLFDNETDPWQMDNLIGEPSVAGLQADLDRRLRERLRGRRDAFLPGHEYVEAHEYALGTNDAIFQG